MRSEKKQTIINLIAKTISYGTTMIISFFLTPYLVAKIGKEAYSFYPMANNFVNYMGVITTALNSMGSRFITVALTQGNKKKANEYFYSILISNIILSAVLAIPMTVIVVFLDKILDIPLDIVVSVKTLFALVFISMIVNLLTNVFGVAVFSQNRMDLSSVCDIIVGISRVMLYLFLFMCFKANLVFVGIVSLIVALFTCIIQFAYTKKLLPFMKYNRNFYNWQAIKEVLSSGVWNSVNQIGSVLLSTVGLMLCNMLWGASEAGDYSIALTIPQFINGIVSMLCATLLPGLTITYARGNMKSTIQYVRNTQNLMAIIINIPIAVFMAIGVNFFKLWMPTVDPYKLQKLSILAIGYLLVTSVAWPVSNLNTVMNRVKVPAIVMVITGISNIILIGFFYMYTDLGLYSVPLSQLILFVLNRALFVCIYSAKCLGEKCSLFYPAIGKALLCAAIIFIISKYVDEKINPTSWLVLIAECFVLGLIGVLINSVIILKPKGFIAGVKKMIQIVSEKKKNTV